MSDAAEDIRQKAGNPDGPVNTRVSVDGAWQRRGFSSLNGNMATVSLGNGKVLDVEPLSRHCRQCKSKASLKASNIDLYNKCYEKQQKNCTLNYQGSAGIMEVVGSKSIFSRSIDKHNFRYDQFLGYWYRSRKA